jgi:hypothetical protein
MTKRPIPLGAKFLVGWWLIVIIGGLFGNSWMAVQAFKADAVVGGLVFCVLGIGCAVLCYRTYSSWDEFPGS